MGRSFLPPGFRFHPTDVELVQYYLKRKIMGKKLHYEAISEVDMYKFAPWDLPDKVCLKSKDLEWYFFCPRDRKYGCGQRVNRTADIGYWKTTGKDRPVYYDSRSVGMRKTLVFHMGKAPHGERTDWLVHEYRLEDNQLVDAGVSQGSYVLCRLFQKSGMGPKNGEQYGAPFKEEEWEDDTKIEGRMPTPLNSFCNPHSAVDETIGHVEDSPEINVPVHAEDPVDKFLSEVLCDEPDPLALPGSSDINLAPCMIDYMYYSMEDPAYQKPQLEESIVDPHSSWDWELEMMLLGPEWETNIHHPQNESYLEINDLWSPLDMDAEHRHGAGDDVGTLLGNRYTSSRG